MRIALSRIYQAVTTGPAASPAWLVLRIYLGSIWLRFGWSKVQGGWLLRNQVEGLLQAVADGATPVWTPLVRPVAEVVLSLGLDGAVSVGMPIFELAVGLAFIAGIGLVPAALGASLLNLNLILMGVAGWRFDGRIIVLQLLLLAGWRSAGLLGVGTLFRAPRAGRIRKLPVPQPTR